MIVIKPEWRTDTVMTLCASMRVEQDYTATPILADALQDADCDNQLLLSELRLSVNSIQELLVAQIYLDEAKEAIEWLTDFATEAHYNLSIVLRAGRKFLKTGQPHTDAEHYNWDASNAVYEDKTNQLYWKHFQIVTGLEVPEDMLEQRAFECPC